MKFAVGDKVVLAGSPGVWVVEEVENPPGDKVPYCIEREEDGRALWVGEHEIALHIDPKAAVPDNVTANAAVKHAKPRFDLLFGFGEALMHIAGILTFGAAKYAPDSWKRPPFTKDDYLAATGRHLAKIGAGELRDVESGKLHAAHLACDTAMYLWHVIQELPEADRTRY